jgi:hypothetical protein
MTKVVYNACYGGFGLSKEAVQRYWEIKDQQVWIEDERWEFNVYLVPPEERLKPLSTQEIFAMSKDERIAYNEAYSAQSWYYGDVVRHDPALVQVVEELGDKANGMCANLTIKEVDGPYRIEEYDGFESVETADTYEWITP